MTTAIGKRDPLNIVISGTAGQGAVFSATLIAEAAAMHGKQVSQTALSSAAVRSGSSTAHIIISDTSIDFPYVETPDILIALSQRAFDVPRRLAPHGMVFFDSTLIAEVPRDAFPHHIPVPATRIAAEANLPDANLILLGVVCRVVDLFPIERLLIIADALPDNIKSADIEALRLGADFASTLSETAPCP